MRTGEVPPTLLGFLTRTFSHKSEHQIFLRAEEQAIRLAPDGTQTTDRPGLPPFAVMQVFQKDLWLR